MTDERSAFQRTGTGVLMAARITGLCKAQIRFIADQGHLGTVRRVKGQRRFSDEQLVLLQRIGLLHGLGLLLTEAAALARDGADAWDIDVGRLSRIEQETASRIQRYMQAWVYLCALIDRRRTRPAALRSGTAPKRAA